MDIWSNPTKKIPKKDPAIVRVDFSQADIGGRKSHLPNAEKSDKMNITHVPSPNGRE